MIPQFVGQAKPFFIRIMVITYILSYGKKILVTVTANSDRYYLRTARDCQFNSSGIEMANQGILTDILRPFGKQ